MKHEEDAPPERLPVTAEVGDEGGSYADGAVQAETFSGVFGNPRVDPKTVGAKAGRRSATAPEPDEVTQATETPERER